MVSITISSSEGPDISYTSLLCFICQDVINLCVFPSGEGQVCL